jgi:hypothetical protein
LIVGCGCRGFPAMFVHQCSQCASKLKLKLAHEARSKKQEIYDR